MWNPDEIVTERGEHTPLRVNDYLHGYCHQFAGALSHVAGYNIILLWDLEFTLEGQPWRTEKRMLHAVCVDKAGNYFDIRGHVLRADIESEFDISGWGDEYHQLVNMTQLDQLIADGVLDPTGEKQLESLVTYINNNLHLFKV